MFSAILAVALTGQVFMVQQETVYVPQATVTYVPQTVISYVPQATVVTSPLLVTGIPSLATPAPVYGYGPVFAGPAYGPAYGAVRPGRRHGRYVVKW